MDLGGGGLPFMGTVVVSAALPSPLGCCTLAIMAHVTLAKAAAPPPLSILLADARKSALSCLSSVDNF